MIRTISVHVRVAAKPLRHPFGCYVLRRTLGPEAKLPADSMPPSDFLTERRERRERRERFPDRCAMSSRSRILHRRTSECIPERKSLTSRSSNGLQPRDSSRGISHLNLPAGTSTNADIIAMKLVCAPAIKSSCSEALQNSPKCLSLCLSCNHSANIQCYRRSSDQQKCHEHRHDGRQCLRVSGRHRCRDEHCSVFTCLH